MEEKNGVRETQLVLLHLTLNLRMFGEWIEITERLVCCDGS